MENFIKGTLENYGIYINLLWHISYAIKIWLNVVMEGFVMGLILGWWPMQNHSELDYGTMGLDFMGSGGQGGTLSNPQTLVLVDSWFI